MVLVPPELIRQDRNISAANRIASGSQPRLAVSKRGAGCVAKRTTETRWSDADKIFRKSRQRAFAAQHDVSARRDLGAKAQIATPPGGRRKQLRQPAMLKVGKPSDRRKRQAPAKKARVFEHDVDALGPKFGCGRPIEPERQAQQQDLHDDGQKRAIARPRPPGICARAPQDRRRSSLSRRTQPARFRPGNNGSAPQTGCAGSCSRRPKAARDSGECDAQRGMVGQRT